MVFTQNVTWVHQTLINDNQANPVDGTWYPILATTPEPCRILVARCQCTHNVVNVDLQIRIILDGETTTHTKTAAVTATNYYVTSSAWPLGGNLTSSILGIPFPSCEGRRVSVDARAYNYTLNGGSVTQLAWIVSYALKQNF